MSNTLDWAKREVEIACGKKINLKEYHIYNRALETFEHMYDDGLDNDSLNMFLQTLECLLKGNPITPIEDIEDVWNEPLVFKEFKNYQCKRFPTLFKNTHSDGTVKYCDFSRVSCIDIDNPYFSYSNNSKVLEIIDELFPITMPYNPKKEHINVYCEDFLYDKDYVGFDTFCVLYAVKNNSMVNIDRYFRKGEITEKDFLVEISEEEYRKRKYEAMKRRTENE